MYFCLCSITYWMLIQQKTHSSVATFKCFFPAGLQIASIYSNSKTVYGIIQDRIQVVFRHCNVIRSTRKTPVIEYKSTKTPTKYTWYRSVAEKVFVSEIFKNGGSLLLHTFRRLQRNFWNLVLDWPKILYRNKSVIDCWFHFKAQPLRL